jgi:hypothetical protein
VFSPAKSTAGRCFLHSRRRGGAMRAPSEGERSRRDSREGRSPTKSEAGVHDNSPLGDTAVATAVESYAQPSRSRTRGKPETLANRLSGAVAKLSPAPIHRRIEWARAIRRIPTRRSRRLSKKNC